MIGLLLPLMLHSSLWTKLTRSDIDDVGDAWPWPAIEDDDDDDADEAIETGNGNPGKIGFSKFRFESIPVPAALMAASEGRPAGTAGNRPPRGKWGSPRSIIVSSCNGHSLWYHGSSLASWSKGHGFETNWKLASFYLSSAFLPTACPLQRMSSCLDWDETCLIREQNVHWIYCLLLKILSRDTRYST